MAQPSSPPPQAPLTILANAVQQFVIADPGAARYRLVYGPPDAANQRPIVGLIRDDYATAVEEVFERDTLAKDRGEG